MAGLLLKIKQPLSTNCLVNLRKTKDIIVFDVDRRGFLSLCLANRLLACMMTGNEEKIGSLACDTCKFH